MGPSRQYSHTPDILQLQKNLGICSWFLFPLRNNHNRGQFYSHHHDRRSYSVKKLNSLTAHFIIGIICFSSIIAVGILGILTKLLNICQAKSNTILLVRKLHAISGYVIVGLCKINLYIVSLGWIAQDIPFVIIFIVWKLYFPRMENKQISPKFEKNI